MIEQFYPDEWLDSAYVIDYEKIYKKLKNINQQMILSDLLLTCIIHTFRIG